MDLNLSTLFEPAVGKNPAAIKVCCAAVYNSEWLPLILGESYHPGKLNLTHRLGELLALDESTLVLDVAAGRGESALYLAETFGCEVVGVDHAPDTVQRANRLARERGLAAKVRFEHGDAEQLPFEDHCFEAVLSECAFCTFTDKRTAAAEIARVLRPGGRVGISDLTRSGPLPPELETIMGWVACVADARPVQEYAQIFADAGLSISRLENHDRELIALIDEIRGRLLSVELMVRLEKLQLPVPVDFDTAGRLGKMAAAAARQGQLGYVLFLAQSSSESQIP